MQGYTQIGNLQIADCLHSFIEQQALPETKISPEHFWQAFESILAELDPINERLLETRDHIQQQIDEYCKHNKNNTMSEYKSFLEQIGYLEKSPAPFSIETTNVDDEIAKIAGPQLVVPINNARYAINAANARWGSLYDALYGTDVISEDNGAEKQKSYNPARGALVIKRGREWLDVIAPLESGSHIESVDYALSESGTLNIGLQNGSNTALKDPNQVKGYRGSLSQPEAILIEHNGMHVELQFDATHPIGKSDPTHLKDIFVESALTTIMDCEDSVAAVDAEDKTLVYQNWLGLMQGNLSTTLTKGNITVTRTLAEDRKYKNRQGKDMTLSGRSLMFVRNVGHLMKSNAILLNEKPIHEGIMDAMITSLIAKHDLLGNSLFKNSRSGSIYIVKPKMHGSEEVKFSDTLFERVEAALGLAKYTIKIGIMDEERRTSVNLAACIEAAKHRVAFINTGFLDRTGDEIHTSMQQGAFALKSELKERPWIKAYENANVFHGLTSGLSGKAQIGKGMWAIPDNMADMMKSKIAHPDAGANTAWVPSPTAATLHAFHYHQIDVFERQSQLRNELSAGLDDILSVPLLNSDLSETQIGQELDNNVQGILGYVVRWVHQGIGCSKVPDIDNVGLMEDRATLRISSQHIANWLTHNIVSTEQVMQSLLKMAKLVDAQNADDAEYIGMCPDCENSIAFQAACELIFEGTKQPNGYTEPVLHRKRVEMKAKR